MKKLLTNLILGFSALFIPAMAVAADEQQIKEVTAAVIKEMTTKSNKITTEELSSWGSSAAQAARGIAEAIGIAARELGVSINEFIKTPAGMLTVAVIIWKVAGASILNILCAIAIAYIGFKSGKHLMMTVTTHSFQKVEKKYLWGLWTRHVDVRNRIPYEDMSETAVFFMLLGIFVQIVMTMVAVSMII